MLMKFNTVLVSSHRKYYFVYFVVEYNNAIYVGILKRNSTQKAAFSTIINPVDIYIHHNIINLYTLHSAVTLVISAEKVDCLVTE